MNATTKTSRSNARKIYSELCRFAKDKGLPRRFLTDLTHWDREWLESHPGEPFLWCLYEDGTFLVRGDDEEAWASMRTCTQGAVSDPYFFVWCDGKQVIPLP